MQISEVAQATGLTKKAVKYYESEGLVSPQIDPQSGYRKYGQEDVVRLEIIQIMRLLNMPIVEIKRLLAGQVPVREALQEALRRTEGEIEQLEQGRLLLARLLADDLDDVTLLRDEMKRLRRIVELSREERSVRLTEAVQRIFPGSFGRMMAFMYAPFFDVEIETASQRGHWLKLVEYLDDLTEPSADHPFFQFAQVEDEALLEAQLEVQRQQVLKLLQGDPEAIEQLRSATMQFVQTLKEDPQFRTRYAGVLSASRDLSSIIGISEADDAFNEHLAALNDDYRRYLDIGRQINEEAERELGHALGDVPPSNGNICGTGRLSGRMLC
jgi:DNA-binding transcriptional MerR regulator